MTMLDKNFLLINKPAGWTSFDVVARVRKHARLESGNKKIKVGHAGTLDPFATGLLIVGVGREATKRLDEFKNLPKTYVATLRLGAVSDSYDKTGHITPTQEQYNSAAHQHENTATHQHTSNITIEQYSNGMSPNRAQIESVLKSFLGKQLQIPPMFSAKSIGGVRLYKLARQGKTVERFPDEIEIYKITLLEYNYPILKIEVECSAGTYIRSLANDIGEKLRFPPRPGSGRPSGVVGAYCEELERTKIGPYSLTEAISLDELTKKV